MNKKTKIGILGAGVEGIATAKYLSNHGYLNVFIFDSRDDIYNQIPEKVYSFLGVDFLNDPKSPIFDMEILFRTPGIHFSKLQNASDRGIKISSSTKFFFEKCPCKIIGVTGTKGKGTTSSLIFEILKTANKKVFLGGNIGNSPLDFLDMLSSDSLVVLELSSFQLQDLNLSPHIAVVLMTTSDHLDYHADITEYHNAKKPIVLFQKNGYKVILNKDYEYFKEFLSLGDGEKFFVSRKNDADILNGAFIKEDNIIFVRNGEENDILEVKNVGLIGKHNLENVLSAVSVCMILGIDIEFIKKGVKNFKGLEHRLEFVKEVNGVKFYNDSFSTTPETSISASYAFDSDVSIIVGGSDKNADYSDWGIELYKNSYLKGVYLIGETALKMEKALERAYDKLNKQSFFDKNRSFLKIYKCSTFEEAIKKSFKNSEKGSNVVLSPATASFDMFKNYKVRGETFKEIVKSLK